MPRYWVSYSIISASRGICGSGAIDVERLDPPANVGEVVELGDQITRVSHQRGKLDRDCHLVVQSWSLMADG